MTSDHVYWWRLLLKEYGPKIVHTKGIHNTFADVISRLDSGPFRDNQDNWMRSTKFWCHYTKQVDSINNTPNHQEQINMVFANHSNEDAVYPLTVMEIAQAQIDDKSLEKCQKYDKYTNQLIKGTQLLCKDGRMVKP